MPTTVKGPFDVKATPLPGDDTTQQLGLMRMRFEKRFHGALDGTSVVAMMGMMNQAAGSGAYVALERIEGTLDGRKGTFCLQHSSTLNRGAASQIISVVPDSGTGELAGLSGAMTIDIVEGRHFYTFEYALASPDTGSPLP